MHLLGKDSPTHSVPVENEEKRCYVPSTTIQVKVGPSLVWVQWVLQHPCFSKLWVPTPTLFGNFSFCNILSSEKLNKYGNQSHFYQNFQQESNKNQDLKSHESISTHGFKFLTGALESFGNVANSDGKVAWLSNKSSPI